MAMPPATALPYPANTPASPAASRVAWCDRLPDGAATATITSAPVCGPVPYKYEASALAAHQCGSVAGCTAHTTAPPRLPLLLPPTPPPPPVIAPSSIPPAPVPATLPTSLLSAICRAAPSPSATLLYTSPSGSAGQIPADSPADTGLLLL